MYLTYSLKFDPPGTEIKIQHPQWDLSCVYSQKQKWRETPKRLRHGGKKVEIGQTRIFPRFFPNYKSVKKLKFEQSISFIMVRDLWSFWLV